MIPLGGTDYPSSPLDEVAAPVSVHKVQASRADGWGKPPRWKLKLGNNNKDIRELPDVARARFGLGGRRLVLPPVSGKPQPPAFDFHMKAGVQWPRLRIKTPEESYMDAERPRRVMRVPTRSPEWHAMSGVTRQAMRLTAEMNKLSFDDVAKVRELFSELTGRKVDDTFILIPPFYSAYGRDIRVGHKVFINQCCTIYDMGGVDIADRVMIGPNVSIITSGHPLQPSERRAYIEAKPIVIEENVWIAAGATILGGVTVGENSVVAAGAIVTKDVPPNSFVAGVPAKIVRSLEDNPG
jgi:acetyltransferase-like isoleucine patch superfamily enzyme